MPKIASAGNRAPKVVRLGKCLSNDARRQMLMLLGDGPADVRMIAKKVRKDIAEVSKELAFFYGHGLVDFVVDGRWRIYELTDSVQVRRTRGQEELTIWASDGSSLTILARIRV